MKKSFLLNFCIKAAAQQQERQINSRAAVTNADAEYAQRLLSGSLPADGQMLALPDFTDQELIDLTTTPLPSLEVYEVTLKLDPEVTTWVRTEATKRSFRINLAFTQAMTLDILANQTKNAALDLAS